jgi:Uma2 family endonuclease
MSIAAETPVNELVGASPPPRSQRGDWTWELVTMFPQQGDWTEEEYMSLGLGRLVEFTDGVLEFLPMVKMSHARIAKFISEILNSVVTLNLLGEVFWAPCAIRVGPGKLREPDILYLNKQRIPEDDVPPNGADLVVEVVSEGLENRRRDLEQKREEYAEAGIPEYWIVDPEFETITVLTLIDGSYKVHGEFQTGSVATSVLLPGFEVDVGGAFAAAKSRS